MEEETVTTPDLPFTCTGAVAKLAILGLGLTSGSPGVSSPVGPPLLSPPLLTWGRVTSPPEWPGCSVSPVLVVMVVVVLSPPGSDPSPLTEELVSSLEGAGVEEGDLFRLQAQQAVIMAIASRQLIHFRNFILKPSFLRHVVRPAAGKGRGLVP